jgi:LysM repeat protein
MNGSDYPSPSYGQDAGWGGRMKAFFLLVILFLAFVLFASSGASQADLNPYSTESQGAVAPASGTTAQTNPDVISIQGNNNTAAQTNYVVPVTGTCSNPYTVQSGDILSGIASICNTTVAAIRLANPSITNANLIYPGQQLVIPGASAPQQQVQVPVTGNQGSASNQNPDVSVVPTTPQQPAPTTQPAPAVIPQTGPGPRLAAGSMVQVKAINFPPNTPVNIAIGPQNAGYNVTAASITDASGQIVTNITLPAAPDANTPWAVVVATSGSKTVQAMSQPFYIVTVNP